MRYFVLTLLLLLSCDTAHGQIISISLNEQNNIDCVHKEGLIDVEAKGGLPPYSYRWSTGATTNVISGLSPGKYTVTVTDSSKSQNKAVETYTIVLDTIKPVANAGADKNLDCQTKEVLLEGISSQTSVTKWQTIGGYFLPDIKIDNIIAKAPGLYVFTTLFRLSGCFSTDTVRVIGSSDMPYSNAGSTKTLFCTNKEVMLDGSASSKGQNFEYEWFRTGIGIEKGGNTLAPTVFKEGRYYLKVVDKKTGCHSISSTEVVEDVNNPKAYLNRNPVHLNCANQTLTLTVQTLPEGGSFLYKWGTHPSKPGHIIQNDNTDKIVIDSPGIYGITVTNKINGCTAVGYSQAYNLFDLPIVAAVEDVYLGCVSDTIVTLDTTSKTILTDDNRYYWYDEEGSWLNPNRTSSLEVSSGGMYIIKMIDPYSECYTLDTVFVFTNEYFAQVKKLKDTLSCYNREPILDGSNSIKLPEITYQWHTNNGHILGDSSGNKIKVDQRGIYTFIVSHTDGCADTAFIKVVENLTAPAAFAHAVQKTMPCDPPKLTLDVFGSPVATFLYQWSTKDGEILSGANNIRADVSKAGTYKLKVSNLENGCYTESEVKILAPPQESINVLTTDVRCFGFSDGSAEAIGSDHLKWALDNAPFTIETEFEGLKAGEYTLQAKDSFGCVSKLTFAIDQPKAIELDLGKDILLIPGQGTMLSFTTNLQPNQIKSVTWSKNGKMVCDTCSTLIIQPFGTGIYQVIISDLSGCTATDEVTVEALDSDIYTPNVFSPNGDGANDLFYLFSADPRLWAKQFSVFSRWGDLVFSVHNIPLNSEDHAWDGNYNGHPLPAGVYSWFAVIKTSDKNEEKRLSGNITIIR